MEYDTRKSRKIKLRNLNPDLDCFEQKMSFFYLIVNSEFQSA